MNYSSIEHHSELGKKSSYDDSYNPGRLLAIPRAENRNEIGIHSSHLPFQGFDLWNHYEVSWLNEKGKPIIAMAEIIYDCTSPYLIESKSLKLYFNSFNHTRFKNITDLETIIQEDIAERIQADVSVSIKKLSAHPTLPIHNHFTGESIDELDVDCSVYLVEPSFLSTNEEEVKERLYSDLLKSNCPVTHQPDWGSIQIEYTGQQINREGLLKYIISFRHHHEFHESCIERIFMDIMTYCKPKALTIYGRYTRRGGLDINPFRTTQPIRYEGKNIRLIRQ